MIIYYSKIKKIFHKYSLFLLPIIIGLINNYLYISFDDISLDAHLFLIGISIIPIIGSISSLLIFEYRKKFYNYIYCLFTIVYGQAILFYKLFWKIQELKFDFFWFLLILFSIYTFYPFTLGIFKFANFLRHLFYRYLRKIDINIVTEKYEEEFNKNKILSDDSASQMNDIENEFSNLESDVKNIVSRLNEYSTKAFLKLKYFEKDSFALRKDIIRKNDKLVDINKKIDEELSKIEDLKGISKKQLRHLLKEQKINNIVFLIIGALIGFILNILASYVYAHLSNFNNSLK
jgi:hypothetical protein